MTWMPSYLVEQRGLSAQPDGGSYTFYSFTGIAIVALRAPPIRPVRELHPVKPPTVSANKRRHIFDLGQNMVGRVRLRIRNAKPGQTIALVGHTGSGKTTIISILNRLYDIQKGRICIDGVPLQDYKLAELRSRVGVVLQDVFLFAGSVYENITLRNPVISREQVEHAAKLIGMHEFIQQLPGGYDFPVMERGSTLSLGQRQLISFIRALLYNPAILILDEATSSVDTEIGNAHPARYRQAHRRPYGHRDRASPEHHQQGGPDHRAG